ncbi:MAG: aspartate carbamoyltransferase regulatory subunit [Eubacteriales bacterium]|nr:aspartate carbamoyltransferase regulatory subunit [Eubacteriales bacterium]
MKIDSIQNGIVIDHITAGGGMKLYELLDLKKADCSVAMLMNVVSSKMGKKDIIKLDADIPVNLDAIGYVDPGATVNYIKDGVLVKKQRIGIPKLLKNVIRCRNPRCITSVEQELDQVFKLTDPEKKIYRCLYCETKAGKQ